MLLNFVKKIFKQADGQPDYHLGPTFDTAGSSRFVFNREFGDPVEVFRGAGRLAGSLRVTQHPQVMVPLFAPQAGIGGVAAGTIQLQPLTTPEELA